MEKPVPPRAPVAPDHLARINSTIDQTVLAEFRHWKINFRHLASPKIGR
jgi:hypothetical protein